MIVNNSIYQLLIQVPLDMIPNIIFITIIGILIILGLIFRINGTKSFLKALFHKYMIFILVLSSLWAVIIFWIFGNCLMKYYSVVTIVLTVIFSVMSLCIISYKMAIDNYFLKNMLIDNFRFNALFCVFVGVIPQIFTFNLCIYCIEFFKSLLMPLVLEVLFLPVIYVIAVINEYKDIKYILAILSEDIGIYEVFKKYNLNLRGLHRFNKQLTYKNSTDLKIVLIDSNESEFKLINNKIYIGDKLIGSYECHVEIPEISGMMSEACTLEKNICYIVGDVELENLSEKFAFVYFKYKNTNIKLVIETKYVPIHIWSPLIEDICEFGLL